MLVATARELQGMTALPTAQIEDARRRAEAQDRLEDIDFAFGQRWIAHKGSIGHQIDLVKERFPPVRLNTDHAQIPLIRSLLVEMSWCLFQQKLCHTRSDGVHSGPHQHTPHHEASRIFIVWLTASR